MESEVKLLREFDVWQAADELVLRRYRMVEDVQTGRVAVVTVDFVSVAAETHLSNLPNQTRTFHEQLLSASGLEFFEDVSAAICDHIDRFGLI
jgi:hypothetical protein